MACRLSVIIPTLDGTIPPSAAALGATCDIELVVVKGVRPVGRARNEGLRRAQGEYIAWIDADDEITSDWAERVLAAIATGVDCAVIDVDSETHGRKFHWRDSGRGLFADMLTGSIIFGMYAFVVKREKYAGIIFDEGRRQSEDARVLAELLPRVKTAVSVGYAYRYRYNANSLMHTSSRADELDQFLLRVEWAERWHSTPIGDIAFAHACKWAGWTYEWYKIYREPRAYLRKNFFRAMRSRELNLAWKIKIILVLLGLVRCLRPVYRLHARWQKA